MRQTLNVFFIVYYTIRLIGYALGSMEHLTKAVKRIILLLSNSRTDDDLDGQGGKDAVP